MRKAFFIMPFKHLTTRAELAPIAVSVEAATVISGLGRTSLFKALKLGALPARKSGRRTVILVEDLKRFMEALPLRVSSADSPWVAQPMRPR
jgi:hypothetical protein